MATLEVAPHTLPQCLISFNLDGDLRSTYIQPLNVLVNEFEHRINVASIK
jgi:hypothetical protein